MNFEGDDDMSEDRRSASGSVAGASRNGYRGASTGRRPYQWRGQRGRTRGARGFSTGRGSSSARGDSSARGFSTGRGLSSARGSSSARGFSTDRGFSTARGSSSARGGFSSTGVFSFEENVSNTSGRLGSVPNLFDRPSDNGGASGSMWSLSSGNHRENPFRGRGSSRGQPSQSKNADSRIRNGANERRKNATDLHKKRLHPAGFNDLLEWSTKPPDVVIHCLLNKMSGVRELLAEDRIPDDKMVLLIKVLAVAASCASCRQNLMDVFSMVFTTDFVNQLVRFQISLINSKRTDLPAFLDDQLRLLLAFKKTSPTQARELLPELVQGVELILPKVMERHLGLEEVKSGYGELSEVLKEAQTLTDTFRSKKIPFADRLAQLDDYEPEDDYRDLPIEPTPEDFAEQRPPLIRRNITQGAYKDVHNYLDVQFRLLREDFVRPLREGVCQVRSGERATKDVRLYKRVTFQETQVVFGELVHFVKLNLPKNFKIESSKRLLFGNLMCFSADNFATYFLATVAGKDVEMLRKGLVGVKLLVKQQLDPGRQYTVVESRAFFTSYKHVLKALQLMDENTLPLAEHIVFAEQDIDPPEYLLKAGVRHFDFRVVLDLKYMKPSKASKMFPTANTVEPQAGRGRKLEAIPVLHSLLTDWPAAAEFGLDQSQLTALHAALTKRLVIIQGPPGTGKTFLGLKITQVLLHNSHAWTRTELEFKAVQAKHQRKEMKTVEVNVTSPILVICYTNHALDQFLEGMLKFTKKIIRIGSRSKSEEIQRFQINEYVKSLRKQRCFPAHIHHARSDIRSEIDAAENRLRKQLFQLKEISKNVGLISLDLFLSYGVIPSAIAHQFIQREDYRSWMLPVHQPECYNQYTYEARKVRSTPSSKSAAVEDENTRYAAGEQADDDEWHDAFEMLRDAENERIIDVDDDLLSETDQIYVTRNVKTYEVTVEDLEELKSQLMCLSEQKELTEEEMDIEFRTLKLEEDYLTEVRRFCEKDVSAAKEAKIIDGVYVFHLAFIDRCLLYAIWRQKLLAKMRENLRPEEVRLQKLFSKNQEVKNSEYLHVARQADVVGLTTTGAAQFQAVVQELRPRIVIIEEAAEILEAHVVASLSASCEHLIMIGDHQQLKPSPTVYQLAKHYGLDTSLFERMINNGVAYETLAYQHRMRPEISSLLVPSIYPSLKDHQSVQGRPHIRGVEKSVFFVSHEQKELAESDDNNSHSNLHEAAFIMRLARHLVLQGYSTDQITVLTPYSGQFFLLRKEQRKYAPTCDGMQVTIVDNFQGEENDIILLSLVRSNDSGSVGFLKIENRVCVALSRAKLGLFIIGNMDQLRQSSDLWVKIEASLKAIDGVGEALVLRCSNHPDRTAAVKTEEDLRLASPEGGCTLPCTVSFPLCGHPCPRVCHPDDPSHTEGQCRQPCERKCTKRGHPCTAYCFQECPPCLAWVEKKLPCEHSHLVPCHISRKKFQCPTKVKKVIEACGHIIEMLCHEDVRKAKCPIKCDVRLDCGHSCGQLCHVNDDPDHVTYLCQSQCTRNMKGCTEDHKCTLLCYQTCLDCTIKVEKKLPCGHKAQIPCQDPVEAYRCNQKCRKALECGHYCTRRCCQPCGGCTVMVSKRIEDCGHTIQMECGKIPTRQECTSKACPKRLPCGHKCPRPCSEPCGGCQETVSSGVQCLNSSHTLLVPCSSLPMPVPDYSLCRAPCRAELQCEHQCRGSCGECFHGRFHLPCAQKCSRVLVCGHVCKSPCSASCPPCQDKCRWQCTHSRCNKTCGVQCTPCQEPCSYRCSHRLQPCAKKCGEVCDCLPCEEPCPKLLKCGHPCVGLCGDPCPPLCRVCHLEELTEFYLLGNENEPDARFVLLQDCGHVIEYEGLSGWLQQRNDAVQMKRCPRCQEPIYNNRRFKNLVLETYKDVQKVLLKHVGQRLPTLHEIVLNCSEEKMDDEGNRRRELDESLFFLDCVLKSALVKSLRDYFAAKASAASGAKGAKFKPRQKEFKIGAEKLQLYIFQLDVIKKAKKVYKDLDGKSKEDLEKVMERVMSQNVSVVRQFMEEVQCELQRLRYVSEMKSVRSRSQNTHFVETVQQIDLVMGPTLVFTADVEAEVKRLLKVCESYVGGLGLSDEERLQIVKAMTDVRRGAWYKCPNGHIYCIADCGGAMVTSKCSECGATIGGSSHRLLGDNSLASEMDGAAAPAWPQ